MRLEAPLLLLLGPLLAWYAWRVFRTSYVGPARTMLYSRITLFALLVLALARPELSLPSRDPALLALVDDSVSMLPSRRAAITKAVAQLAASHPNLAVWRFGADIAPASVQAPFSDKPQNETRLERALFGAEAALPESGGRRIVLFTDGRETDGDARRAARALGDEKIEVYPIELPAATDPEALIVDLRAPQGPRRGEQVEVSLLVRSTVAQKCRLSLSEGGRPIWDDARELKVGDNEVSASVALETSGVTRLRAEIFPDQDSIKDNNAREQTLYVSGPPRVLFGTPRLDQSSALADALTLQGIDVVRFDPLGAPSSLEELAGFDAVVLDEIDPARIDEPTQAHFESYVRDLGGGLLFVTGKVGLGTVDERSPLQRVLPLGSEDRVENQIPPVAMVLVVDRSGSMEGDKLAWTKRAALGTIEALPPDAQLGMIAFDAEYRWIAPLTTASNKKQLEDQINSLSSGGGTRFYPALESAYFSLADSKAAVKHVILLTDGLSTDGVDFKPLAAKMHDAGITLSTVAISRDADLPLLKSIAQTTGGRSYVTNSASEIRTIFVDESHIAAKRAQVDRAVQPVLDSYFGPLARLDLVSAPKLSGYVSTTLRPGAQQVLSVQGDKKPLLGLWRYGLGQAAVFTSETDGEWARSWVTWAEYPRLWSELVRQLMRDRTASALSIDGRIVDGALEVSAEIDDVHARTAPDFDVELYAVDPNLVGRRVEMSRVGPGVMRGRIPWASEGAVVLRAKAQSKGQLLASATRILDRPITPELVLGDDDALLHTIAQLSGGEVVSIAELDRASTSTATRRVPLAPWLLGLAFFVYFIDLFIKRVRPTPPRA